jgi:prepilin-type N-terminal cleavage/methylation domain-containing protein
MIPCVTRSDGRRMPARGKGRAKRPMPSSEPSDTSPARASRWRQGFTLIELLVVIAIIALLAGLLLPALNRAKESGRRVTCMNNLHQMAIAISTYSLDSRGHFPDFRSWLYSQPNLLGGPSIIFAPGQDVSTGKLFPYLNSKAIYLCPTDKRELEKQRPAPKVREYSYPMNCRTCHPADLANYRRPAKTFLLMEANMTPTDFTGLVGPNGAATPWFGVSTKQLAFRHNQRGHLLMADAHIESLNTNRFAQVSRTKRFWFPDDDLSGPGAVTFPFEE